MKVFLIALTPLVLALPSPSSDPVAAKLALVASNRDADAMSAGLYNRDALAASIKCDIIGVSDYVNCRRYPRTSPNSKVVKKVPGTQKNINFYCYTNCESVSGNTSWDWTADWGGDDGCYITGHYTDDTCSRGKFLYQSE
ncbi:hypothetical protein BGZ60DRAFT_516383 [Tricladium varicosporioides]|nr:hypothetical protein BGZ60DRAFT_516383 [Hymenoscyphus varicosporioides]